MSDEAKRTGERKQRSDKGMVMATRRDIYCLKWIAEMYAARFDQIQKLLSRFPDKHKPFKQENRIAETTTKDVISRWQRAGWIEYKRFLADGRGYAWVTRKGLALIGLDELYTAKAPAVTRLAHVYAVNQVRLYMDVNNFEWTSERRYRAGLEKVKKGTSTGPIPDGVVTHEKYGKLALEIELSAKKPADLVEKLQHLLYATSLSDETLHYEHTFPRIWVYVSSPTMKVLTEAAREKLRAEDQGRVSVGVAGDLIA